MTQYENNTNAYLPTQLEASPALDTLCQDLDSFIGELTDDKKKTPVSNPYFFHALFFYSYFLFLSLTHP